ncbi:MAG: class I SAM-dependent methyltransferase [Magnetococcales bacterium]|nr:class I SAM-dependent methyltransferase [Magnetococcales bacterium]
MNKLSKNETLERISAIIPPNLGGFGAENSGGSSVSTQEGGLLYAICKVFQPKKIIETGTHHGTTTNYLLKYCSEDEGHVYSFDVIRAGQSILPELKMNNLTLTTPKRLLLRPKGDEKDVSFIRNAVKSCANDNGCDLFLHDSDHRYENVRWEWDTIRPHMVTNQIVVLHDVLGNSDMLQTNQLFDEVVDCQWKHIFETENGLGLIVL